jgi:F0F1-type ATP synthase membrane subunit b/b'
VSDVFDDLEERRALGERHDAEELVRTVLELVLNAKAMPLSASVLVSRDEVAELLQEALERMPEELRQARWLLKERDAFLADRQREADALLEEVKVQAERMVQRTEIVRQANLAAQRIVDDANEEARRLRHEAEDYADQKLASFEIVLDRTLKTVQAGREKLRVTPLQQDEPGDDEAPEELGGAIGWDDATEETSAPQSAGEPDTFFDQDLD